MAYRCTLCMQEHEGLPHVGMRAPDPYLVVPEEERSARTTFTSDLCTVRDDDGEHFFVRGVIRIRVHGEDDAFGIGAWVSQSKVNYERYTRNEAMDPTFGWLVNRITAYSQDTFLLKTTVHFRVGNQRPTIQLEPCDHPLALDQHRGISLARAWEIVHVYMR